MAINERDAIIKLVLFQMGLVFSVAILVNPRVCATISSAEFESVISTATNKACLESLIRDHATVEESQPGYWKSEYLRQTLLVITDQAHDRMQIITSVVEVSEEIRLLALAANFDRAPDARYAR